jgi:hypothetical protein
MENLTQSQLLAVLRNLPQGTRSAPFSNLTASL